MKRIHRAIALVLMTVLVMSAFSACGETEYKAASGFFYSADKGHSYGDGTKEYEVGETVYMKVKFKVTSDEKKTSQIKVVLSIPNVECVDTIYLDGQVITPNYDAVNNVTTYEFTANASKDAMEHECTLQFVPNAVGMVRMTLIFDDNVDPSFDLQSTLIFVESEQETMEE